MSSCIPRWDVPWGSGEVQGWMGADSHLSLLQPRVLGVGGRGFMQFWLCGAPLSAWLGCIRPQSCVVRGAGIQKSVFLHPFPLVLLVFFPLASDLLMFKKIINKKLFMWSRYGARAGGRGAWSSRGRGWAGCGGHTGDWRVVGVAMWMGGFGGVACFAVGRCVGVV